MTSGRNYDVMPDGKSVVALFTPTAPAGTTAPAQITVLLNFFDELARKVGQGRGGL